MNSSLLKVFQAAAPPQKIASAFTFHDVTGFRSPLGGNLYNHKKELSRSDLLALEKFFRDHPPISKLESSSAFFSFYPGSLSPVSKKILRNLGWKETKIDRSRRLNIFKQLREVSIPAGYEVRVGTKGCHKIIADHARANNSFFKTSALYRPIRNFFETTRYSFFIVNLFWEGKLVGTGNIVYSGKYGAFFSGSVHPEHRSRGLWKALLGIRQRLSYEQGVRTWYLTTTAPAILKKSDFYIPYGYFTKP